ncbi:MAG: double-strand break repair helicase AddA [Alphaproteobacteria bacterium]|nr:double-strand break repair helicase AddA [Alphaproteobacteria bacterium]
MTAADEAIRRATDPGHSAWVSANAGSGKTFVLTRRIIRLLTSGVTPERLLCLTYTKAAAAEMVARLQETLGKWTLAPESQLSAELFEIDGVFPDKDAIGRARRLFARALETPGGLKVQTIHAFCERLLQCFPFEAELLPDFLVLDESEAEALRVRAVEDTMRRAVSGRDAALAAALARLAARIDALSFADAIDTALKARRTTLGGLTGDEASRAAALTAIAARLGVDPADDLEAARAAVTAIPSDIQRLWPGAAAQLLNASGANDRGLGERLQAFLNANGEPSRRTCYSAIFLTQKDEPRKLDKMTTVGFRRDHPAIAEAIGAEHARVSEAVARADALDTAQMSAAYTHFLSATLARYEALKRARSALDFDDLVAKTRSLLERSDMAAWVLFKLDGGIDHILVDEAQDTSPDQWAIVDALGAEFFAGESARGGTRTVFAVGDEKQSIYSFQGAEPRAFAAQRERFRQLAEGAGQTFAVEQLPVSRRSLAPVLEAVDRVFSDPAAAREIALSDDGVAHQVHRSESGGFVELWPLVETQVPDEEEDPTAPFDAILKSSAQSSLAARIAREIDCWLTAGGALGSSDKPIDPGDILILLQSRTGLAETIVRRLKDAGVAVAGADRLKLESHIAVQDLLSVLRFVVQPLDDLNLAALLKSPVAGLSEDALFELAYDRRGPLLTALRERHGKVAGATLALEQLTRIAALSRRTTPFGLLSDILGAGGLRRRLIARLGSEARDPIDELLHLALRFEQAHVPSHQAFLAWFEAGGSTIKRDLDRARGEVRLMTVHGAKGLEAEIVFLADAHRRIGGRESAPLIRADGTLLWRQGRAEAVTKAKDAEKIERRAENRRLLYVAMTRARERLYLCGTLAKRSTAPNADSWYALFQKQLQETLEPAPHWSGEFVVRRTPGAADGAVARARAAPLPAAPAALPASLLTPAPAMTPRIVLSPSDLPGVSGKARRRARDSGEGERARQRGRAIHRLFELLPAQAASERRAAARRFLTLPGQGFAGDELADILQAVFGVMEDETFAPLFGPRSRGEVAVIGDLQRDGKIVSVSGRIDRLVVEEGRVLIVDFKTDASPPAQAADIPAAHIAQMAAYDLLLRPLFPGAAIRALLLYTSGPLLCPIAPEALEAAVTQAGLQPLGAP